MKHTRYGAPHYALFSISCGQVSESTMVSIQAWLTFLQIFKVNTTKPGNRTSV